MSGEDRWFEQTDDELDGEFNGNLDGDEFPEADFDDDPTETVPCSHCGTEVYEDAVQCPACGTYITHESGVWSGRPVWWIVLGSLGVLAAILTLAGYFAR